MLLIVVIFNAFIKDHAIKAPATPYLSTLMTFENSFEVTILISFGAYTNPVVCERVSSYLVIICMISGEICFKRMSFPFSISFTDASL